MKKLMMALAALAMVGAAQAAALYNYEYDAMVCHYSAKDATPGDDHANWYSFYGMTQTTARELMGVSTAVTYSDIANWLGKNFAVNKSEIIEESQAFDYFNYIEDSKQYDWYGDVLGKFTACSDYIGVAFFDNGKDLAYNVLSANGSRETFHFDDTASSFSTGWRAVGDVPEPTSGMLMLLGLAGLALRRKRS